MSLPYYLKIQFFFCFFLGITFPCAGQNSKVTLNVLSPLGVVSSALVAQFEKNYETNVRFDFIGSKNEYEAKLQSGFRNYDLIIANERVLEKLFLGRFLYPLSESLNSSAANAFYPLELHSKINADGTAFVTLMADPLGVAYLTSSPLAKEKKVTVELIEKLFPKTQFLENPLELYFLNEKVTAAAIFYSTYMKYKKIVPDLTFAVPLGIAYYDRMGIAMSSKTTQETAAENFIRYLKENEDRIVVSDNYLSNKTLEFQGSKTINWVLYENVKRQ